MITKENKAAFRTAFWGFLESQGACNFDAFDCLKNETNSYDEMRRKMQEAIEARNLAEIRANDLTNPTQAIIDVLRSIDERLRAANEMTVERVEYEARNRPREPGQ